MYIARFLSTKDKLVPLQKTKVPDEIKEEEQTFDEFCDNYPLRAAPLSRWGVTYGTARGGKIRNFMLTTLNATCPAWLVMRLMEWGTQQISADWGEYGENILT